MKHLVVGSRGSALALRQTEMVIDSLKARHPDLSFSVEVIKTKGDKILDAPLAKIGDKGLFVKEIEEALIGGTIDFAVHSAKDLPADMPASLMIAAYPEREDPSDVLVSKAGSLSELPEGAIVGTSSLRRRAQLLHIRPDLHIADLRGNLDTRLRKLDDGHYQAILLAGAGLKRLGLADRITQILPFAMFLPAAGQGALAVQCRKGDPVAEVLAVLDHAGTRACVVAEQALLLKLGAGCQAPLGVLAQVVRDGAMELKCAVVSLDGREAVRKSAGGSVEFPQELALRLATEIRASDAARILDDARAAAGMTDMGAAG